MLHEKIFRRKKLTHVFLSYHLNPNPFEKNSLRFPNRLCTFCRKRL
ncbi:unnamed protein product [Brassica rapa subsp. trilocularis]